MNSGGSRKRSDLVNNQGDSNDWIRNLKPVVILVYSKQQESEKKKKKNKKRSRKSTNRRRVRISNPNENQPIIKHPLVNMPNEDECLSIV